MKNIGVPVSVGIAPSKTLAKLASERAKKDEQFGGVCNYVDATPAEQAKLLEATPLKDIWGIGWRLAPQLKADGLHTALDLSQFSPHRAAQLMGVHGKHLVAELQGTSCIPLETHQKAQKSIMRGRTFGEDTNEFYVLEAAAVSLTARAAAALRRDGGLARTAAIVLDTNKHKPGFQRFYRSVSFATPTADTGKLCEALLDVLADLYSPGQSYHRANIFLLDLTSQNQLQTDLFGMVNLEEDKRARARMRALDDINQRFGTHHLYYAAEDLSRSWQPKHNRRSPRYTTTWDELPVAQMQL
jgi:DNA polymerase V